MTRRIDAHQHYWQIARGDYHWMPTTGPLARDYLPADLQAHNAAASFDGTIVVQAAPTLAETEFLLDLAGQPGSGVLGVVGWVDLEDGESMRRLETLAQNPKLVAVRPMIQDLADDEWVLRPPVINHMRRLPGLGLRFDLLSHPQHLPHAYRTLEQIPDLDIVIDHLSKPRYRQGIEADDWRMWMERFAQLPRAHCKLSGMVTEVGQGWQGDDFRAHADVVLEAFGPQRVMFGSDWPVCLLAATHAQVVDLAAGLTAHLPPAQQAEIWGGTAARFYGV